VQVNALIFRRKFVIAIVSSVALVALALAGVFIASATRAESQTQSAAGISHNGSFKYEYDVVSIKIIGPEDSGANWGIGYSENGLTAIGVRMFWMFRNSYGVTRPEIVGAPEWFDDVRFAIEARQDSATGVALQKLSPDQLKSARQEMLRKVLAERFGLKFHYETRELPVYFLTIAKGGSKLQEAKPDYVGKSDSLDINGVRLTDTVTLGYDQQPVLVGQATSIKTLTEFLSQWALSLSGENARPVLDRTGLAGRYDFAVKFSQQSVFIAPPSADSSGAQPQFTMQDSGGPNLFKALQDGLGLKMESGKGPDQVIVIDHIEKPSAN